MRRLPAISALIFLFALFPFVAPAQEQPSWVVQALNQIIPGAPPGSVDVVGDTAYGTNVFVQYGNATLISDSARLDYQSGEVVADGRYLDATRSVLRERGGLWFFDESYVISRRRA